MFGFYLMDLLFTNLFFLQISEEGHCSAGEPLKYVAKHSSEYFLNLNPFSFCYRLLYTREFSSINSITGNLK
jgi:hypothetical protein